MPAIVDRMGLKERLRRAYVVSGSYAAAGKRLGVNRQQMRQFVIQEGGYTDAKKTLLEPALDRFERKFAAKVAEYDSRQKDEPSVAVEKQQNPSIPNIAQHVLRYVLDAVEARQSGGGANA